MSLKLQEELGDSLDVVFVDVGRESAAGVQKFALKRKWLGGRSMWTKERPFSTGLPYIPAAVLLSSDGEVLYVGNPIDGHKEIVRLIEEDLAATGRIPPEAPKEVAKLHADFAKGQWAKAMNGAQALVDKPPAREPEAVVAAAQVALEGFRTQFELRVARIEAATTAGAFARATELLAAANKAARGQAELSARLAEISTRMSSEELKAERAAGEALAKLEKKLYDKGPDKGVAKALRSLAEAHGGTAAGARAAALADVAEED